MPTQLTLYEDGGAPVTADGLNTFIQSCDFAADLRAFIGVTGMQVYMRGYSAVGDGGQGNFYWNATAQATDDNGATAIVPYGSSQGAWIRISTSTSESFSVDLGSDFTLPVTGTAGAIIPFGLVEFKTGAGTLLGGRYTVAVPGLYIFSTTVNFKGTTPIGTQINMALARNTTGLRDVASPLNPVVTGGGSNLGSLTISSIFEMAAGDVADVRALGLGMTTCIAAGGSVASYFAGALIGS